MNNNFNLEEIKELIKQGKSNEEIINDRIKYLTSDDYKKNHERIIDDEGALIFESGFIDSNTSDTLRLEIVSQRQITTPGVRYSMSKTDCYNDILDIIRKNMDMILSKLLRTIYNYVINYFEEYNEKSKSFVDALNDFRYNLAFDELNAFKSKKEEYIEKGLEDNYNRVLSIKEVDLNSVKSTLENYNSRRIYFGARFQAYNQVDYDGDFFEFCKAQYVYKHRNDSAVQNNKEYMTLLKKYTEALSKNKDNILSTDISDIAGFGIGACVERSLLAQNLLTFCGIESYKMDGLLDGKEPHAFNIVATTSEPKNYYMIDAAMKCATKIEKLHSIEDVKHMKNIELYNSYNKKLNYTSAIAFEEQLLNNSNVSL